MSGTPPVPAASLEEALERLEVFLSSRATTPDQRHMLHLVSEARSAGGDVDRRSPFLDTLCGLLWDDRSFLIEVQNSIPYAAHHLRHGAGDGWDRLTSLAMQHFRRLAMPGLGQCVACMCLHDGRLYIADHLWYGLQIDLEIGYTCAWPGCDRDPAWSILGERGPFRWVQWQRAAIRQLGGDPDLPAQWLCTPRVLTPRPVHGVSQTAVLETTGGRALLDAVRFMDAEFPSVLHPDPRLTWASLPPPEAQQLVDWTRSRDCQDMGMVGQNLLMPNWHDPYWYRRLACLLAPTLDPVAAICLALGRLMISMVSDRWSMFADSDGAWMQLMDEAGSGNEQVYCTRDGTSVLLPLQQLASPLAAMQILPGFFHLNQATTVHATAHGFLRAGGFELLTRGGVRFLVPEDTSVAIDDLLILFGPHPYPPTGLAFVDGGVIAAAIQSTPAREEAGGDGWLYTNPVG